MDRNRIPAELAARYARIVDDSEFARMHDIMWPDFTQKGPGFGADSCEAFVGNLEFLRRYQATFHFVGQQHGAWEGDRYNGETYCIASHFYNQEGEERRMDMGIRYQETIEVRGGAAKYSRRDLIIVWTEDRPMGASA